MSKTEKAFVIRVLHEYMRVHNLDQKEMAKKLEVSASTFCAWLNPDGHGISHKHSERVLFICRDVVKNIHPGSLPPPNKAERYRFAVIAAVMASDEIQSDMKDVFYHVLRNVKFD